MRYCSNCGEPNSDNARFCAKCGYEIEPGAPSGAVAPNNTSSPHTPKPNVPMPETYLWQSIVVTILCCLPLGIPAIVYAAQVEKYYVQGHIDAAQRASRNAKNFCIASLVSSLVAGIAYIIYLVAIGGVIAGLSSI
jgi:uncharacterized membrane protein YvbJ